MKILVLSNFGMGLYKFRKELLNDLIDKGYEVYISLPEDNFTYKLEEIGCKFIKTNIDRRGINPIKDLKLLFHYLKIIKRIQPDVVLTYTIKPNLFGGIACRMNGVPYIANITGWGSAFEKNGLVKSVVKFLYKTGIKKASCVFFQNRTNKDFILKSNIITARSRLIPGSGVNLKEHKLQSYPDNDENINLLFIGRIMKEKGIEELLEAAKIIKQRYPHVNFNLIGGIEEDYSQLLNELGNYDIVNYYGEQREIQPFLKKSHATILPSYHEGLSNVLLESASAGRPVLASKIPGCVETFEEGTTGLGFKTKSVESLVETIETFIKLPYEKKKTMGLAGRGKMENEFDRKIVLDAYLEEINLINEENLLWISIRK